MSDTQRYLTTKSVMNMILEQRNAQAALQRSPRTFEGYPPNPKLVRDLAQLRQSLMGTIVVARKW